MSTEYDVAGALPEGTVEALPSGTNVLITGPAMVGKREVAFRLLAAGHEAGEGVLCVTTKASAASLLREFERQVPTLDPNRVGIVDCSGSESREAIRQIATERVGSPGDLTGVSIGTAKLLKRFSERDVSDVRHGLVSISTLIQYLDVETVFKFVHIYTSRIEDTGGLGVFTLEETAHDPQTTNTITSEFDCVIELRETEDGREVRVKGLPGVSRSWYAFD
ncbi:RAD55 family ATPase [Halolamina sp. C58]|uniref:RAD55 family ATPase n=1 Tax=Halolamina sp. C58 TaxID=3421640 RepID=UPI003EBA793B